MATPTRALTALPQKRCPAHAWSGAAAGPQPEASLPERMQVLQGAIGNRAVGELLGAMAPRRAPLPVLETLVRDGRPLDPAMRAVMEHRLGADLGAVRLHTDGFAADSARAIGAKAYAAGHHVVFGPDRFTPETAEGRRLLAHELTHVVQQGAGTFPAPPSTLASPSLHPTGSPAEREAVRASSSPLPGPIAHSVPAGAVMREPEGEGESKGVLDTVVGGLIGDFNEDPTLAEIGINTGVGLIPVVGEATAARDVTANVYYMAKKEEYTSPGRWIGLVFAIISLFPEIGAAIKGLGKAIVKGAAKAIGPIIRLMERVLEKLGHSEGIRNFFLKNWSKIVTEGTALFEKVMAKLSSLLTRAVKFISSKAEAFTQGLERIRQAARKALPEAFEKAKNLIDGVLERLGRKEEGAAAKSLEEEAEKTGTKLEKQAAADTEKAGTEAEKALEGIETGTPPLTGFATPHRYVRDPQGRAQLAEGWLRSTPGGRSPSAQARLVRGYNVGEPRKYHATHLIADSLGGVGDRRNLVLLDGKINVGAIASLEDSLRKRVAAGEQLFLRVQAEYVGGGSRSVLAERLTYEVFTSDGKGLVKEGVPHVFEALTKVH